MKVALVSAIALSTIALVTALAVQATPFSYSEPVFGDLPGIPPSAFALDVGSNTIEGTTHFAPNFVDHHFDADVDSFAFVVSGGISLSSISLAFATTTDNASQAITNLELCTGISFCAIDSPLLGPPQTVDLLGSSPVNVDFGGVLPLASGTYTLFTHGLGIAPIDTTKPESLSVNYTWTLNVVPEPGSLSLLVAGVLALGFAVRSRRSRAPARA